MLALAAAPAVSASVQPFALASATNGIVLGPDGNLWVSEQFPGSVARVSPAGRVVQRFSLSVGGNPTTVATGPGGKVWVALSTAEPPRWSR